LDVNDLEAKNLYEQKLNMFVQIHLKCK